MAFYALGLLLALLMGSGNAVGVEGFWKTPSGAVLQVYACGKDDCFKIVKLSPTIPEKSDVKNPDGKLKSRQLCGLRVGSGFKKTDADHLEDGHIYDPESGHTYSGTAIADGDAMKLRGYVGISLLGRTEVWKRNPPVVESECR